MDLFSRLFTWTERRPITASLIAFLVALFIRYTIAIGVWHLIGFPFQRYDPYLYTLKGLEIASGDFSPVRTHAIGWPLALGTLFSFIRGSSIFENLASASLLSVFLNAACVFPFLYLVRRITPSPRIAFIAAGFFIFAFSIILPENDSIAMSEPLFLFLFLSSLAFLYAARQSPLLLHASTAAAAGAYWTRPNGILLLPIILFIYRLWSGGGTKVYGRMALTMLIFFLLSFPFLYQRYAYFGSGFDYGENGHFFANTYTDAWGAAIPTPSLFDYLSTHSLYDWFFKFGVGGIGLIAVAFFIYLIPHIIGFVFQANAPDADRRRLWPLWIACGVWAMGLIPVFHIYYNPRHILPLIPPFFIVSAIGFDALISTHARRNALAAVIVSIQALSLVIYVAIYIFVSQDKYIAMRDGFAWARELAPRLSGAVAIGNGSDILMMMRPDTRVGGHGLLDMEAPRSDTSTAYPGKFDSLDSLTPWLKHHNIRYIIFDDMVKRQFLFAPDKYLSIYTGTDFPYYLREEYSNYDTNSQWKVRAFRIDWDTYRHDTKDD